MMPAPQERWQRAAAFVGQCVNVYDCVTSTSDLAREAALAGAASGTAFLANEQTAGRGQYGRTWLAPPGQAVLLSVILRLPPSLTRPVLLTAWAAVAVCATVRTLTGQTARIKWPNDVYLAGRKLAGILIEQVVSVPQTFVAAGIGLNVGQSAATLAAQLLPGATSLQAAGHATITVRGAAEQLLTDLDHQLARLYDGRWQELEHDWREQMGLLGCRVRATLQDGSTRTGILVEQTVASVILQNPDGVCEKLSPEVIRHLVAED